MLVLLGRIQYRVAIAEHNKAHHLLTEISSTVGKVVLHKKFCYKTFYGKHFNYGRVCV